MKTVVYISDFMNTQDSEKEWIKALKQDTQADCLVGVMSGDYLQNGFPAARSRKERKDMALGCGVDAVLEMSLYASVSSIGIYAYGVARVLEKLRSVHTLVMEIENTTEEKLREISLFLVKNPPGFQQRVVAYKKSGMTFYPAQAKVLGEEIEGAEEVMNSWHNIFAVEMMTALKYMYSNIQIHFVPKRKLDVPQTELRKTFSDLLKYRLAISDKEMLADVYGGNDILSTRIQRVQDEYEDFESFARLVAGSHFDLFEIRKYFLHMILGINKSNIGIFRMYDFAPYCQAYAREDFRQQLEIWKERSQVILLNEASDEKRLDRSLRRLLDFERRTAKVYEL